MDEIPEKVRLALEEFGHSEAKLAKFSGGSFVVQDLGRWGDDFDEFYEVLAKVYGRRNQVEARYCPNEFSWMKQPFLWLPFVSQKKHLQCEPLSLKALDRCCQTNSNQSRFAPECVNLCGAELAPLGECGGPVELEGIA